MSFKVLIAEDEEVMRFMLTDFLENFDYEILQAENGQQAYDIWKNEKCDILITDINMPKMNGIELLKNIKNEDKNFPVIVITGVSVETAKLNASDNGADAFLVKPFKMKQLVEQLDKLLYTK
ncbi:MAG: response regulator [Candidatus Cloacimonetes bacterium]|jgi:DNA-binding response OmpR family regulator|nr:response regulator [Candidatus Cloacimonadota bacterium]